MPEMRNVEQKKDTRLINTTQTITESLMASSIEKEENLSNLPWHYRDKSIEVALTGKAFKLIEANKERDPFTFKSVLAKAQVFARMSPDDKALLVSSHQKSYLN